ncbi:MAG: discoidin domain-containing protein [Chloroflexi bacterium]|nr:discoidin domain-containing protein [Chloroflexota bacterium]
MKDLPVSKSISVAGVAPNATATIVLWNDQTYPPRELERRALQENGLTYEIPARSAVVFALSSSGSPAPPSQPTAASTPVPAPTSTPTPSPLPTATPPAPTATPTAVPALVNVAQGRPAVASSMESSSLGATLAVDGNGGTRWASRNSDPQWIYVDLGTTYNVSKVVLKWETAYGRDYQVQLSDDATNWRTIYNRQGGTGGTEALSVSGSGRYVRIFGTTRGVPWWGYSLWELEVYGKRPDLIARSGNFLVLMPLVLVR